MFFSLTGKIQYIDKEFICLNVNGLGFKLFTPVYEGLSLNMDSSFFVCDFIKDENYIIYGFKTERELKMFNKLMTVNGVGMKTAISLLRAASIDQLVYLIKNKKVRELSSVYGVGTKANNIVFELENKLEEFDSGALFAYENVYRALINIGYKPTIVKGAIDKLEPGLQENDAIKETIRIMRNNG